MNPFTLIPNPFQPKKWKDKTGKVLSYGDLLIQGTGVWHGYTSHRLWIHLGQQDTRGYYYLQNELCYFFHCSPSESLILNVSKLNQKFIDLFMMGFSTLSINTGDNRNIHEIINTSDLYP